MVSSRKMAATTKSVFPKGPLDKWSTREQLALASSVKRSGDQNWVSVSRTVKLFGEQDRPTEWFSQKNCALQYADLLEKAETPKRKRGEKNETTTVQAPADQIITKLSIERIEELKRLVTESQQRYKQLKKDIETVRSGQLDDNLEELWNRMENDRKAREAKAEALRAAVEAANAESPATPTTASVKGTPATKNKITKLKINPSGGNETSQESMAGEDVNVEVVKETTEKELPSTTNETDSSKSPPPQSPGVTTVLQTKSIKKEGENQPDSGTQAVSGDAVVSAVPQAVKSDLGLPSSPSSGAPTITALLHSPPPTQSKGPAIQAVMAKAIADSPASKPLPANQEDPSTLVQKKEAEKESETETEATVPVNVDEEISFKQEEAPPSPASSVSSRVSEGGKATRRRSSKGKAQRPGSRRSSRRKTGEDDKQSSRADSSDEGSDDMSTLNTSKTQSIFTESIPNSPASMSQCSDTEEEKHFKIWKKSIMLVYRAAANHKFANIFLHSVTDEIAPGYSSVVFRPMNLTTIKKNIESGAIRTTIEFQRDMMLMFTNAIMYNSTDQIVYTMAMEMYDDVMKSIEQYVSTQLLVQSSEAKVLRASRRSEASDKEEDSKRRRVSTEHVVETVGGKTKRRKTRADE